MQKLTSLDGHERLRSNILLAPQLPASNIAGSSFYPLSAISYTLSFLYGKDYLNPSINSLVTLALYKKAIEINPNYADAYNNLANAYNDMGKKEEALFYYKKALEVNPNHGLVCNNLAVIYYEQRKYDLAVKYSDRALELAIKLAPIL